MVELVWDREYDSSGNKRRAWKFLEFRHSGVRSLDEVVRIAPEQARCDHRTTGRLFFGRKERGPCGFGGLPVAKVVELVGTSKKNFDDAINEAVRRAGKTIRNVSGLDVVGQKAIVKNGKVVEYRVNLKLAFGVD